MIVFAIILALLAAFLHLQANSMTVRLMEWEKGKERTRWQIVAYFIYVAAIVAIVICALMIGA